MPEGPDQGMGVLELNASVDAHFRRAMARFASGVVIVAAESDQRAPIGMTCQSFASLSLAPPLVTFAAGRRSTSFPPLHRAGAICISVLTREQEWLSAQFAVSGSDKWCGVQWAPGRNSAPRIAGAAMWCEGNIVQVHEGGDHLLAVVEVTSLAAPDQLLPPLIFHDGRYAGLHAGHFDSFGAAE
jgi:3-hydroxy-9,10-secoandrosta-1,3,5(10)-triene-9,17-dione monooxygenase reductase component